MLVEVLSYVSLRVEGGHLTLFQAIVMEAPPLHDRYGTYQAFNMHEEWTMKVIGVERLQAPVGLMKENSAGRQADDGWCAVCRGPNLSTAPFVEIAAWE